MKKLHKKRAKKAIILPPQTLIDKSQRRKRCQLNYSLKFLSSKKAFLTILPYFSKKHLKKKMLF
jgi:hypothetical protein